MSVVSCWFLRTVVSKFFSQRAADCMIRQSMKRWSQPEQFMIANTKLFLGHKIILPLARLIKSQRYSIINGCRISDPYAALKVVHKYGPLLYRSRLSTDEPIIVGSVNGWEFHNHGRSKNIIWSLKSAQEIEPSRCSILNILNGRSLQREDAAAWKFRKVVVCTSSGPSGLLERTTRRNGQKMEIHFWGVSKLFMRNTTIVRTTALADYYISILIESRRS